MTLGAACLCVCVLGLGASPQSADLDGFSVRDLVNGQRIEIQTDELIFQFEVVDSARGETIGRMSKDNKTFGKPATVFLIGATRRPQPGDGGVAIGHMHEIKRGMSMELGVFTLEKANRLVTSPVRRISLQSVRDDARQK